MEISDTPVDGAVDAAAAAAAAAATVAERIPPPFDTIESAALLWWCIISGLPLILFPLSATLPLVLMWPLEMVVPVAVVPLQFIPVPLVAVDAIGWG